jgi:hypothetical protein
LKNSPSEVVESNQLDQPDGSVTSDVLSFATRDHLNTKAAIQKVPMQDTVYVTFDSSEVHPGNRFREASNVFNSPNFAPADFRARPFTPTDEDRYASLDDDVSVPARPPVNVLAHIQPSFRKIPKIALYLVLALLVAVLLLVSFAQAQSAWI